MVPEVPETEYRYVASYDPAGDKKLTPYSNPLLVMTHCENAPTVRLQEQMLTVQCRDNGGGPFWDGQIADCNKQYGIFF